MLPRKHKVTKLIFVIVLCVSSVHASIAKLLDTACVIDKYSQYAATQEKWQRDQTKLVLSSHPQFIDVAHLYLEDQLIMIELRRITVEYIARYAPEKLNPDASINQWISQGKFSEEEIAKSNKLYSDLLQLAKQVRNRPPHPDGDALRNIMREKVVNMPEYKALAKGFNASVARIEKIVCM